MGAYSTKNTLNVRKLIIMIQQLSEKDIELTKLLVVLCDVIFSQLSNVFDIWQETW